MTNLSASLRASSPAFSPSISKHWNTWRHRYEGQDGGDGGACPDLRVACPCAHLPADRVQLVDVLLHVLVHVEGVDHRVDFEGHFVPRAPAADLVKALDVALLPLSSADQLVGVFIETVTGDGQDVQIVT